MISAGVGGRSELKRRMRARRQGFCRAANADGVRSSASGWLVTWTLKCTLHRRRLQFVVNHPFF